ncbi:hypothetical protein B0H13DRAFT_1883546 [Mycena leptocephala]|nr:hypothetical protein B0H13DRAFT_1883546 [Mycena leptocephala]
MLALFQKSGTEVVAHAEYGRDFMAIRQSSIHKGSLFAYKKLPQEDDGGFYESKGSLWNYIGIMFGQVQGIFNDVLVLLAIRPDLVEVQASFYVRGDVSTRSVAGLRIGANVVVKVTIARVDMPHPTRQGNTRVCDRLRLRCERHHRLRPLFQVMDERMIYNTVASVAPLTNAVQNVPYYSPI